MTGLRPALLPAGGRAGHELHLPLLRPHHHRETIWHQVAGSCLDIFRQRDISDSFHPRPSFPPQTEEKNNVDLTSSDGVRCRNLSVQHSLLRQGIR